MIFKIYVLICSFILCHLNLTSHNLRNTANQKNVCIRIKNNSKLTISKISVFSTPFKDLNSGAKSKWKTLKFNKLTDDAMLYLTVNSNPYAYYLEMDSLKKWNYTYVVDSINQEQRLLYISTLKEKTTF